ncbi:nucleolar complex protein 2 homolog [Ischnura elegans]|uniref:nucleolar complex protein 2 homolog n=1 Tax=Ischnura elegans TaxID=197161 RepID=UPI001ED894B7|nr:nucleolar complex protein 2 homolog [Ischnura elegans]
MKPKALVSKINSNPVKSMVKNDGAIKEEDSSGSGSDDEDLSGEELGDESESSGMEGDGDDDDCSDLEGEDGEESDEPSDIDGEGTDEGSDQAMSEEVSDEGDSVHKEASVSEGKKHKKALQKLKKSDPEFYQFLEENDKKLLQFDVSDSESEGSADEGEAVDVHVPPEELEGASDESDYEPEEGVETVHGVNKAITLQMVEEWQQQLPDDKSINTMVEVMKAFHAAVQRVDSEEDGDISEYKVTGSSVFNAVVRLCVVDLPLSLRKMLKISPEATHFQPSKCKKWKKIQGSLKRYLTDLLKLLSGVSSENILRVLLKHNHQMIIFWCAFSNLKKPLIKHLVKLWSTSEDDTVRILSFLCLLRLNSTKTVDQSNPGSSTKSYETTLKIMYLAYVQNTKFVSPSVLPGINFMRQSLSEMYALNEAGAYPHVFMYIRQLAIHLRNAITLKKKESVQAVYNWQFVNSLHLWAKLLAITNEKSPLRPLLYPLVQVAIGTVKLIPTAQYYPLRFHILRMLIQLSSETGVFIPILPFLIEILHFNFNKKHTKVSMKPMNFNCILRLSKSQLQENGFKDAVMDAVYEHIFMYLATESHRIGFPDLVIPLCMEIRKFNKTCKVANYCRKMKQVLEKVEENAKVIESHRKVSFSVHDRNAILEWETNMKNKGTPLFKFWESYNKLNAQKKAKRETGTDKGDDFEIPVIKKPKKVEKNDKETGPVVLFPSSDESEEEIKFWKEDDLEEEDDEPKKVKKLKKKKLDPPVKKIKVEEDDGELMNSAADIVQDLNISEYD